jgi:hypothetical protein
MGTCLKVLDTAMFATTPITIGTLAVEQSR